MSKYEELKYVLSGATDWGYEYAKRKMLKRLSLNLKSATPWSSTNGFWSSGKRSSKMRG